MTKRTYAGENRHDGSGPALPDAPVLRVYLLGTFRVEVHGQVLGEDAWPRKKSRQLLKCLLTREEPRMLKEELIDILWPESDPRAAAASLRTTLSSLRQALEPANVLASDQSSLWLRSDLDIWTDVRAFEALVSHARGADDSLSLLQEADALYRGDLLPDDLYEDWPAERREQLKSTWTEVMLAIARRLTERGDIDQAASAIERVLAKDSCNEQAAQALMRLLIAHDRRPDARRVFKQLVQSLKDELGVEPLPSTVELAAHIAAPTPSVAPAESNAVNFVCSYPFPMPEFFVGRGVELARIEAILTRGRSRGEAALIGGSAGRGKSTLLGRLARQAERGGVVCLAGAAYAAGSSVPFGPFHDALADWLLSRPPALLRDELGVGAADLAYVVPELRYHLQLTDAASSPGSVDLARVFAAIHSFLRQLASVRPVMVCVEDLHYADTASVQLFGYLARQLAHATKHVPLVLLGTYRPEDVGRGELANVIAGRQPSNLSIIELRPLDDAETAELAGCLLAGPASHALNEWLYKSTDGNPLFVEQLVLALREEGRIAQRGGQWHEVLERENSVPPIMREVIGQRFARLSNSCRETLQVAAVLGQTLAHDELIAVMSSRDERSILENLAEALEMQFLHEAPGGYVFAHALVRETIYYSLNTPRRMLLHRRAGEALEQLGGSTTEARASSLAYHYAHAGSSWHVREKALDYSLVAGRQARALSAPREALAHFSRACELIDRAGRPIEAEIRMDALEGRAHTESLLARWPESIATSELLLAIPEASTRRGRIRKLMAYVYLHMGDMGRAQEVCQLGLAEFQDEASPASSPDRLYLQQVLGLILYLQGRWSAVVDLGNRMLSEADVLGESQQLMLAHAVLGLGFEGLGEVARGLEQQQMHLHAAEMTGAKARIALAHESTGFQYYLGGQFAAAREHLQRALALYADASELQAANTHQHLCRIMVAEGELARAEESLRLMVDVETIGRERWAADGHQLLGTIHLLRAEWEAAQSSFEHALAIRESVGDRRGIVESTVALGHVQQSRGWWQRAEETYQAALDHAANIDPSPMTLAALSHHARLRSLTGGVDEAAAELEVALSLTRRIPETLEHAPTLLAAAELALMDDEVETALQHAEEALATARPIDQHVAAHVMLARAHLATQHHHAARPHAVQAVILAQRLSSPQLLSSAHLVVAQLEAATGRTQAASAAFDRAARFAATARVPFERALALRAYADHLHAHRSRPEYARQISSEASALFSNLTTDMAPTTPRPVLELTVSSRT